jgi:hypothetical protein
MKKPIEHIACEEEYDETMDRLINSAGFAEMYSETRVLVVEAIRVAFRLGQHTGHQVVMDEIERIRKES